MKKISKNDIISNRFNLFGTVHYTSRPIFIKIINLLTHFQHIMYASSSIFFFNGIIFIE